MADFCVDSRYRRSVPSAKWILFFKELGGAAKKYSVNDRTYHQGGFSGGMDLVVDVIRRGRCRESCISMRTR